MVDKPKGFTSFDIVAQTRKRFHCKAVGHTGTLDPFATGLLVLLLGRYTRLCEYVSAQDKTYEAEICFGFGTDTDDCEGQVIATADASGLTLEQIKKALQGFLGKQLQVPPQYSAISIRGERAYQKARRGEKSDLLARPITIYSWVLLPAQNPPPNLSLTAEKGKKVRLRLRVSKGTYIRAIARDLGTKLGIPAHLNNLRRIACGSYDISECSPRLQTGIQAIRDLPLLAVDQLQADALKKGQRPEIPISTEDPETQRVFLAHCNEDPIALVRLEQGRLIPVRGF